MKDPDEDEDPQVADTEQKTTTKEGEEEEEEEEKDLAQPQPARLLRPWRMRLDKTLAMALLLPLRCCECGYYIFWKPSLQTCVSWLYDADVPDEEHDPELACNHIFYTEDGSPV